MPAWPAIGLLVSSETGPATYEHATSLTRIDVEPAPGMLVHLAGPAGGESWVTMTVWRDREDAERFLAGTLGESIAATVKDLGLHDDFTYLLRPAQSYMLADDARGLIGRRIGEAKGEFAVAFSGAPEVADVYREGARALDFPN